MPGIAIFASGYLAVRLQKKEHARQAALQAIEDQKREKVETRRQKTAITAQSHAIHKLVGDLAYEYDDRTMLDAVRQCGLTTTPYRASGIPGAQSVGFWLARKQFVALRYIKEAGSSRKTAGDVQEYFLSVQHALDFWVNDSWAVDWFRKDADRMVSSEKTLAEEDALLQDLTQEPTSPR
jgi:hypothetical protein